MRNIKTSLIILFAIMLANVVAAEEVVTVQLCEPSAKFLFGCETFDQTGVYPNIEVGGVSKTLDLRIGEPSEPVLIEDTIAVGETYLFACQTLTSDVEADLEAEETYTNVSGCDSVVVLHLALREPVIPCEPIDVAWEDDVFVGETYLFACQQITKAVAGDTVVTETYGCDSVVTLTLHFIDDIEPTCVDDSTTIIADTISLGQIYLFGCELIAPTQAGDTTAYNNYPLISGCDSVVTLNLYVCDTLVYRDTVSAIICPNEDFLEQYWENDTVFDKRIAGTPDTIRHYDIRVVVIPTAMPNSEFEAEGATFSATQGKVVDLTDASNVLRAYYQHWSDSIKNQVERIPAVLGYQWQVYDEGEWLNWGDYFSPGYEKVEKGLETLRIRYVVTTYNTDEVGCGSVNGEAIDITTNPWRLDSLATDTAVCQNTEFVTREGETPVVIVKDTVLSYSKLIQTPEQDYDSVFVFNVTMKLPSQALIEASICYGDSIEIGGRIIKTAESDVITIENAQGCDSVITYTVTVLEVSASDTVAYVCQDETVYEWHGQTIELTLDVTEVKDTLKNSVECDSIITLTINRIVPVVEDTEHATFCENDTYEWIGHNMTLDEGGIYYDTIRSVGGCDSLYYTLDLRMLTVKDSVERDTIAAEELPTFMWHDQPYVEGQAIYYDTLRYPDTQCDSIRFELHLAAITRAEKEIEETVCAGSIYQGRLTEHVITEETEWIDSLRVGEGLDITDSLYHYIISVYELATGDTTAYVCQDDAVYEWHGKSIELTMDVTEVKDTLTSVYGCDSVVTLTINKIIPVEVETVYDTICALDTYTWQGHDKTFDEGGTYYDTIYSVGGCDSLYYVLELTQQTVEDMPVEEITISSEETATFEWRGHEYVDGQDIYYDTLRYTTGCDSIRYEMHLSVVTRAEKYIEETVCAGSTYYGRLTEHVINDYTEWMDSLRLGEGLNIVDSIYYYSIFAQGTDIQDTVHATFCEADEAYEWEVREGYIKLITEEGIYNDTLASTLGCDSIIYTLKLTRQNAVTARIEEQTIKSDEIEEFEWRGHGFEDGENGTYRDTAYYTTGCDSVYNELHLTVITDEIEEVVDTVCVGTMYQGTVTKHEITAETEWSDTIRTGSGIETVDHITNYHIYAYHFDLPTRIFENVTATCGEALDLTEAKRRLEAYTSADELYVPYTAEWFIIKGELLITAEDYVPSADDAELTLQVKLTSECGTITSETTVIEVGTPSVELEFLVDKYDHWLLMVHKNYLESEGYILSETGEEVSWYRIGTGRDGFFAADEFLGNGLYYTTGEGLTGKYYAIIHLDSEDGCGVILRSNIIDCTPSAVAPRLMPNYVQAGEPMWLVDLDPLQTTDVKMYDAAGKLVGEHHFDAAKRHLIPTSGNTGSYLLHVKNGDVQTTLKYMLK